MVAFSSKRNAYQCEGIFRNGKSPKRPFRAFKMNFWYKTGSTTKRLDFIAASGCLQGRIFAADICHMSFLQIRLLCLPPLLARASLL